MQEKFSSCLRLAAASLYTVEALAAQKHFQRKLLDKIKIKTKSEYQRDKLAQPHTLLPLRRAQIAPQKSYMAQISLYKKKLEQRADFLASLVHISTEQFFRDFGLVQLVTLLLLSKPLLGSGCTKDSFWSPFLTMLHSSLVLGLMSIALICRGASYRYLWNRLGATIIFITLGQLFESEQITMLSISLLDLVWFCGVLTLYVVGEVLYSLYRQETDQEHASQLAVNRLAHSIFNDRYDEESAEKSVSEHGCYCAGYALLDLRHNAQKITLLRYNGRLHAILGRSAASADDKASIATSLLDDTYLTVRHPTEAADESPTSHQQFASHETLRNVIFTTNKKWQQTSDSERKSSWERSETIELLSADCRHEEASQQSVAEGVFGQKTCHDLKITVQLLCDEDTLLLMKVQRREPKREEINGGLRTLRSRPYVKASLDNLNFVQSDLPSMLMKNCILNDERHCIRSNIAAQDRSFFDSSSSDQSVRGLGIASPTGAVSEMQLQLAGLGELPGNTETLNLMPLPQHLREEATGNAVQAQVAQLPDFDAQRAVDTSQSLAVAEATPIFIDEQQSQQTEKITFAIQAKQQENQNSESLRVSKTEEEKKIDSVVLGSSEQSGEWSGEQLGQWARLSSATKSPKLTSSLKALDEIAETSPTSTANEGWLKLQSKYLLVNKTQTLQAEIRKRNSDLIDYAHQTHQKQMAASYSSQVAVPRNWRSDEATIASKASFESPLPKLTDNSQVKNRIERRLKHIWTQKVNLRNSSIFVPSKEKSGKGSNRISEGVNATRRKPLTMKSGNLQLLQSSNHLLFKPVYNNSRSIDSRHKQGKLLISRHPLSKDTASTMTYKTSRSSVDQLSQRIQNDRIFVYKIIHDLRHPTESLSESLALLGQDLSKDWYKRDTNLKYSKKKAFRYIEHRRVKKAEKFLRQFILLTKSHTSMLSANQQSCDGPLDHSMQEQQLRGQDGCISRSLESVMQTGSDLLSDISKRTPQAKHRLSSVSPQSFGFPNNLQNKVQQQPHDPVRLLQKGIQQLRGQFYSINIEKIKLPDAQKQSPSDSSSSVEGSIVKGDGQIGVLQSQELAQWKEIEQKNKSSYSIEAEFKRNWSSEEESLLVVGQEGFIQDNKLPEGTTPQKKKLSRNDVRDLVERKSIESNQNRKPYRTYSLAMKRLQTISELGRQMNASQHANSEQEEQYQRRKSQLTNVLSVIDQFIEQSAQLSRLVNSASDSASIKSEPHMHQAQKQKQLINQQLQKPARSVPVHSYGQSSSEYCSEILFGSKSPQNSSKIGGAPAYRRFQSQAESLRDRIEMPSQRSSCFNQSNQDFRKYSQHQNDPRLNRSIKLLLRERGYLIQMVNQLLLLTAKAHEKVENMGGQAQMMMTLLRDLMNQAQLANNTFTMVKEYFDCINLIKRCISSQALQAQHKNVHLSGPVILGSSLDKFYFQSLLSDERRYGQVILNFISNSIKFTPAGGHISVLLKIVSIEDFCSEGVEQSPKSDQSLLLSEGSAPDKEVPDSCESEKSIDKQLQVERKLLSFQMIFKDSGCGISLENQKRLFMNFSKLQETQQSNKQGVGLGLSICREIIHSEGGSVDIKSEEGKGTEFIINLKAKCKLDFGKINEARLRLEKFGYDSTPSESSDTEKQSERQSEHHESSSDTQRFLSSEQNLVLEDQMLSEVLSSRQSALLSPQKASFVRKSSLQVSPFMTLGGISSKANSIRLSQSAAPDKDKSLSTIFEKSQDDAAMHIPRRCLLANDNTFLLMAFKATLLSQFETVDAVENGQDAMDMVLKQDFQYYQVIVLDIHMPIMDGIEACIKIKEQFMHEKQKLVVKGQSASFCEPGRLAQDDQQFGIHSRSHSSKLSQRRTFPSIYALTSETDHQAIFRAQAAGFKAIFTQLDQESLKQMLTDTGMEHRVPQAEPIISVPGFNPSEQLSSSSEEHKNQSTSSYSCDESLSIEVTEQIIKRNFDRLSPSHDRKQN